MDCTDVDYYATQVVSIKCGLVVESDTIQNQKKYDVQNVLACA